MDARVFMANTARFMAQTIQRSAPFVPAEKRNWSPMGSARTTVDMVQECCESLERITNFMKTGQLVRPDAKAFEARAEALKKNPPKLEDLFPRLQKATEEYAQTLEKMPNEKLMELVPAPMGNQQVPLIQRVSLPVYNMLYHWGQINYIQTMLGDTEMH
jgi:uncharacterized damage-inducible protein DinB